MARSSSRINFRDAPNQRRRGWGSRLMHLVLGVATLWLIGLLGFIAVIPGQASKIDSESKTDAIIVLTGGSDRLAEGFRLLDKGLSKRLLISGVATGVTLPQLIDRLGELGDTVPSTESIACCVTLGYAAESTVGNADESAEWLRSNGAKSVRLVTANYHMQRSLLEFRRKVPGIAVVPNPVFPSEVRDPHWFVKPRTLLLIVNEYHKYAVALARTVPEMARGWSSGWATIWPMGQG